MTDILQKGIYKKKYYLKAFFIGLGLAFVMFMPFIIRDGGRFLFYGDFNVQQVSFYMLAHEAVTTGNIAWSQYTDLGANFIGSYSFYLLGSPFFWLTIPFPTEWIQYLMGPLFILKFACASLAAYTYLRRYVKNQDYAIIGAILYAFSGFSIYNIFFNHFHEALIIFPFLIAALDEYIATRRRGVFALCVFFSCIFNYYFFVGQVVFCFIYFFVKLFLKAIKISRRDFLLLAAEAVIGFGMSSILMIPSVLAVLQNNRVADPISGWDAIVYYQSQRYLHIIQSMFFMPDLPARPNFTPDSNSKWASLGAWLPLFGMTGVIAWLQQRRKHWLKRVLAILFTCAFVPVLNSAFQLFNESYYARWYYMLTLMLTLATVMSLESARVDWKRATKWSAFIVGAMGLAIGFTPIQETIDGELTWIIGLEDYPTRFWSYVAVSMICLALVVFIMRYTDKEKRVKLALSLTCVVSVLYGMFFIALGKTQSEDPYNHIIPYALNGGEDITVNDLDVSRSDFYETLDNQGMFWGVSTIQAFHSIVPGSIMDFYDYIGVSRDVASRPDTDHYALRGITSVLWLFDEEDDAEYFGGENFDDPEIVGFEYYGSANGYDIWENTNYIPMGFSYDYYITESVAEELSESQREQMMLKAAIIPDEDEEIWSQYNYQMFPDEVSYGEEAYEEDCAARAESACNYFEYTNSGFYATYSSSTSEIVFFSVPYEDGWSATVNGEETEILKTNIGFMSVVVPAGESVKIEFTYKTPGLNIGLVITLVCIILLVIYIKIGNKFNEKDRQKLIKIRKRKIGNFREYCEKMKIQIPTK